MSVISGIVFVPWIIHNVGDSEYAIYTLTMSIIGIVVFDFGFGNAVTRYIVKYVSENDQASANKVGGIAFRVYLIIDILLTILFIILFYNVENIYKELTLSEILKFKTIFIIAASYSIISFPFIFINGVLSAYEKFILLKSVILLQRLLIIALTFVALYMDYGVISLVLVNSLVGILAVIAKLLILKKKTPLKINILSKSSTLGKKLLVFSSWFAVILISQRMIFNLTPSILGVFSGTHEITLFGISSSIEGYFYMIASVINGLFLPKIMRIIKNDTNNDKKELTRVMIKVGRIQLIIFMFLFTGFLLVGQEFITLWLGTSYHRVYLIIIILVIPSFLYLPQFIGNTAILALNKVKFQGIVFLIMAIVNIILASIFSIRWGATGAALAICISYIIRSIGLNIIFSKIINIDLRKFFVGAYLPMILPTFVVVGISLVLFKLIVLNNQIIYVFLTKGIIYTLIFTFIFFLFVLNKSEKKIISTVFYKFKSSS